MFLVRFKKAQSHLEYALLFITVGLAVVGMWNYAHRSVKANLKTVEIRINNPANWEQAEGGGGGGGGGGGTSCPAVCYDKPYLPQCQDCA